MSCRSSGSLSPDWSKRHEAPRNPCSAIFPDIMKRAAGFTMTELVTVIVILGILAAVALPRMSTSEYHAVAFRDSVTSALRYAQKSATSHRRLVCATFPATTLSLRIANSNPQSTCDTNLPLAGGGTSVQSGDTANAVFSPVPAALFFQPDGRGTSDGAGSTVVSASLTVTGQTPITVVGASGHVQ